MSEAVPVLPMRPGFVPRRWQQECLCAVRTAWQEGCSRQLVAVATGSGKGDFIAGMARRAEAGGSRVLILVHLESLVSDLYQRIGAVRGRSRPGMVMAGANDLGSEIVVASVQSMRQPERLKGIGRRDVVIIDEAHHAVADGYGDVLRAVLAYRVEIGVTKPILSLGLTATPYRAGSGGETEGLGHVYDALVYSYTMAQGISDGVLVPPLLTRYDIQTAGSAGEAVKRISSPEICDVVAGQWREKLPGRHTLAFGVDRRHAEELAAAVRRQGGRAQAVDGGMSWQVIQERLRLFREGKLDVLASCDLIREGFDMPVADALMICRPSDSPIVGIQMLGRGLRTHPAKRDCLVLDFTGGRMDLDLDRTADLATNAVEEDVVVKPRPLAVGETVVHRHRGELGLGVVLASGVVVRVAWEGEGAGERVHGAIELVRRSREEHEQARLQVVAVHGYAVEILPWGVGQGPRPTPIGWYRGSPERKRLDGPEEEDRRDWSTGLTVIRLNQRPGAAVGLVRPGSVGWLPWLVLKTYAPSGEEQVECRRLGPKGAPVRDLDGARLLCEQALRVVPGVEVRTPEQDGPTVPLSERTRERLRSNGVAPDRMPESEQEGRAALYACGARIAVAAHLKALRTEAYERKQSRGGR